MENINSHICQDDEKIVRYSKGGIEMEIERLEKPVLYSSKDVAEILGCSIVTARTIMHREDFPLLKIGKSFKVTKKAFLEWIESRHA